jgi:2-polyprenyl-3-methyl-5-hydroxy-6-metoxy-1,4-benzoquinol methylase
MRIFLKKNDNLAQIINEKCNLIFHLIANTDVEALDIDPFYKWYFKKCHTERPFFSLKTSAKLLYDAIKISGKPYYEVSLIDYGAGVGSLYVLAKMIGCKNVFYNDYDAKFAQMAMEIDTIFGVKMDDYIVGDSDITFKQMREKGYKLDLVMSRNVIEHIYDLENYYLDIASNYPNAIIVSSTTANWNNPLAHIQHVYIHLKNRSKMIEAKKEFLTKKYNLKDSNEIDKAIGNIATAGGPKLEEAMEDYLKNKIKTQFPSNYTNICNEYGVWGENLLPYQTHKRLAKDYDVDIKPGIWDEDYSFRLASFISKFLNFVISKVGYLGNFMSSYIILVAKPKSNFI